MRLVNWSSWSYDLKPLDYSSVARLRHIYKNKYTTTNALKANIEKFIRNISVNMLGKVYKNLRFFWEFLRNLTGSIKYFFKHLFVTYVQFANIKRT